MIRTEQKRPGVPDSGIDTATLQEMFNLARLETLSPDSQGASPQSQMLVGADGELVRTELRQVLINEDYRAPLERQVDATPATFNCARLLRQDIVESLVLWTVGREAFSARHKERDLTGFLLTLSEHVKRGGAELVARQEPVARGLRSALMVAEGVPLRWFESMKSAPCHTVETVIHALSPACSLGVSDMALVLHRLKLIHNASKGDV